MSKHISSILVPALQATTHMAACTDCAVSCQSACKTSCTVGNIVCTASGLVSPGKETLGMDESHIKRV